MRGTCVIVAVDIGRILEGRNWGGGSSDPRSVIILEARRFLLRSRKHHAKTPMSTRITTAATTQPTIITGFILVLEETIVVIRRHECQKFIFLAYVEFVSFRIEVADNFSVRLYRGRSCGPTTRSACCRGSYSHTTSRDCLRTSVVVQEIIELTKPSK